MSITAAAHRSRTRRSRAAAIAALAERVLHAPDLDDLSRLLTRDLPDTLGLQQATLLLWDRKLESFQVLLPGGAQPRRLQPGEGVPAPDARFILADGALLETPAGTGEGVLLPLMARSGLIGMLVLGPPRRRRGKRPLARSDVRPLTALALRSALAIENHLYQAELIASERMAALGTMAGMLAHDFRGPMTVIRGHAELLGTAEAAQEVRTGAAVILQAVDRLERMTAETLDFARAGSRLVRRPVVLRELLDEMADEIEREFPGLAVRRAFAVGQATACLDADKLLRAVGNIAANAREAMGGRGAFHMEAAFEDAPSGPRLALLLADEGPGVPPEIRERVFEPFVTRGKKRGTGLGLAVARRFVEDHGGLIELLDEGPGARFRIVLPLQARGGSV